MPAPVVFLDKDDTLIENIPYNVDPARIRLLPGAGRGVRTLHNAGWRLAILSNQSGVARGLFPESALKAVETKLRELLAAFGMPLAGFFYCPHHPEGIVPTYARMCSCRKPAPGMILMACLQLAVEPKDCWMIGDSPIDVEAGRRAGCRTVLISEAGLAEFTTQPDYQAPNLMDAAAFILAASLQK